PQQHQLVLPDQRLLLLHYRPNVNAKSSYFKPHFPKRRHFNQRSAAKTNTFSRKINIAKGKNVTTAGPKAIVNAVEGKKKNDVKSLACFVGNKMIKSFPLPVKKFPLPEYFPTASEEVFSLLSQRDAPAEEVCTVEKLKVNHGQRHIYISQRCVSVLLGMCPMIVPII
nr:hypothetical protein [Tanacetum cinerariifolium]